MRSFESRSLVVPLVSEDETLLAEMTALLDDPRVVPRPDADALLEQLHGAPFGGLIIDGALSGRRSVPLARAFTKWQPLGRVAILAAADDVTTLVSFAFSGPRCDLFFRPFDRDAILNFLRMAGESVGASR